MMTAEKLDRIEHDVRVAMALSSETVSMRKARLKAWHVSIPGWMWRVEVFAADGTALVQLSRCMEIKLGKTLCEVFAAEEGANEDPPD
jgi:hypothetical protein